jgi:transposase InsO family protein
MTSRGLVMSTSKIPLLKKVCVSRMIGKIHKEQIPKQRTMTIARLLQLVHSNLCGSMPVVSRTGSRYILTFIDDFTRKTWLFFLHTKLQTFDKFKLFKATVATVDRKIESLQIDKGGEYMSTTFFSYCQAHEIQRQLTTSYASHQNMMAKRKNRSLLEVLQNTGQVQKFLRTSERR